MTEYLCPNLVTGKHQHCQRFFFFFTLLDKNAEQMQKLAQLDFTLEFKFYLEL